MVLSVEDIVRVIKVFDGSDAMIDGLEVEAKRRLKEIIDRRKLPLLLVAALIQNSPSISPWLELDEKEVFGNFDDPAFGLPSGGSSLHESATPLRFASCTIDCIAMVFKLLRLDFDNRGLHGVRYDTWKSGLQSPTKELFQLIDMDWNQSKDTMRYHKMPFFDAVIAAIGIPSIQPDCRYEQTLGIGDILSCMAEDLGKALGFTSNRLGTCIECSTTNTFSKNQRHFENIGVGFCDAESNAPLEEILASTFGSQSPLAGLKCEAGHDIHHCVNVIHEEELPEILFVRLGEGDRRNIPSTPQRCTFSCNRIKRPKQALKYGWLGSICHMGSQRYKVYWHHDDNATILEYDSIVSESIRHTTIDGDRDDAIPKEWSCRGELAIMQRIYEKGPSRSQKMFALSKQYTASQAGDKYSSTAGETPQNANDGSAVSEEDEED
ncbi:hypothetical protein MMC18_004045 [Xylographa bjoerkii]|nr:hypothetical protein [Xylographa bjoerkii]